MYTFYDHQAMALYTFADLLAGAFLTVVYLFKLVCLVNILAIFSSLDMAYGFI